MNPKSEKTVFSRRRFLKLTGIAGAAALGGVGATTFAPFRDVLARREQEHHAGHDRRVVPQLQPFVDALPIPPLMQPTDRSAGYVYYDVEMRPFLQQLHRDLPPTSLWGYQGASPGPTFEGRRGQPVRVTWRNGLPDQHPLPIDTQVHGAERDKPAVRTVVHLHGAKVLPESDGYPEAWFTNGFARTGPYFKNRVYEYPNDQRSATLWYHDHALGITRLNNYMGLFGIYLLRDEVEASLNLPSGEFEIPLVICDRSFNADGSLYYPVQDAQTRSTYMLPIWVPEFFGEHILVNGKIWPFLTVEPRKYRFRILNASNSRFYRLAFAESDEAGNLTGRNGPIFTQIGSDNGLLSQPVPRGAIVASPAERFDVIVDFSGHEGASFVMTNDAKAPYPEGGESVPHNVMLFRVSRNLRAPDDSSLPSSLPAVPIPKLSDVVTTRDVVLTELEDPADNPIRMLINGHHWEHAITETPKAGSTEIWRIINKTDDAHPIHLHLAPFLVLDRQPFQPVEDVNPSAPQTLTGPPEPAPDDERFGLKDVVQSLPSQIVRILIRFDLPTAAVVTPGQTFRYVFHCHMLEHEENEMMRPYDVIG
ncbi:MAG TPA: multicopper oxidase [Vicinamibacterales bacterium]